MMIPAIPAQATEKPAPAMTESVTAKKIRTQLGTVFPNQSIDEIKRSTLPGFYEVRAGMEIVYISEDARYLMLGDVLDLQRPALERNLGENSKRAIRLSAWPLLKEQAFVDYKPTQVKATVIVFVDPDCSYCQKLHAEIPGLLAEGIAVRYVPFPRQGLKSTTATKLEHAWCAKDPNQAVDQLMRAQPIASATCDKRNQFSKAFELGKRLGVSGTPALLLGDGTLIPGFRPAADLAKAAIQHERAVKE